MDNNITLFQFFHWYFPNDGSLWKHCAEQAAWLKHLGITHVWLPPAYKSAGGNSEPGYAVYDLFDLGEFDQKGSIPTKYGTKDEYIACVQKLHENGLQVLADVVLNHKLGADEAEMVKVREVNFHDRNQEFEREEVIEAYTKFTFPGRKGKYSNFIWDWKCFSGVSVTSNEGTKIYRIVNEYGPGWEDVLDKEFGNFDYLMGSDIEFRNHYVREEMKWWGKWFLETTGVDGFRLDAVKHMSPEFLKEWLHYLKTEFKRDIFCIAEYWSSDIDLIIKWNKIVDEDCQLFDVPFHQNMYHASLNKGQFDMRTILDNTLLQHYSLRSITFVDNHDSQPFQGLESFVEYWFKPHANALTLLRQQGIPCVFYPSIYGAKYEEEKEGKKYEVELVSVPWLKEMILVRQHLAYGHQLDWFDHPNVVGWTRAGIPEREHSGCAVLMSNGADGFKTMDMGKENAQKTFVDITGNRKEKITTNENGQAEFLVKEASVSVWIKEEALPLIVV
jgi:alpha-amylase